MDSVALTESILDFWKQDGTFEKSISTRAIERSFRFYDGPPFTSGDPHYGHLLQSIVKDMVPRWMTMRGYRVERKRGWDCHGIPAENFVNKQLGITSKKQVEAEYGVGPYVEACRTMVNNVNDNRRRFVEYIGRWVDMDNAYFTMDNDYMESVLWVFSDLYHKNLIYKGFKVLGYSRALGTALSSSEIAEGYEDRQDPAVTVKFQAKNRNTASPIEVVCAIVKNEQGAYLMEYDTRIGNWMFPGGKLEPGETKEAALIRELKEELGVDIVDQTLCGSLTYVHKNKVFLLHYFDTTISGEPKNLEPQKHSDIKRVGTIAHENSHGFAIKIENTLIDDEDQIQQDFVDLLNLEKGSIGREDIISTAPVSFLARTTTPWTLPSNMFLAVNSKLTYVQIYDYEAAEYYILAKHLLTKYYKDPSTYTLIYQMKGSELVGLRYQPLFEYIQAANTNEHNEYLEKYFQVLDAEFVTDESGTGIAHEAPAFGEDDYNLVAGFLGRDRAHEWLFNPVDDNGEFTDAVTERAGMNVIDANKEIITFLKHRGDLVKQETINHSYPHCPRTGTPLIYRAMESRFVKEDQLKTDTVPLAEQLNFVPAAIKNRFIEGLKSAPDWNISRSRYWGAPLPVWTSDDGSIVKVVGSREALFLANKPHKQLTKIIFVRHGRTDYNDLHRGDSISHDKARLNELGLQQAQELVDHVGMMSIDAVYGSPMTRCQQTLQPLCNHAGLQYIIDERLREVDMPAYQDVDFSCDKRQYTDDPIDGAHGESVKQVEQRVQSCLQDIISKHPGETVVICSHGDPLYLMRIYLHGTIYNKSLPKEYITNQHGKIFAIEYVDQATGKLLDLHRPYIDDIVLSDEEGAVLKRIPDVLDCWFESGSMPYGQVGYIGEKSEIRNQKSEIYNPTAQFIAEGLDQTRGWFRALHVLGTATFTKPIFEHVAVTGMILAEDGKKMSKSKKNYPDPRGLLEQYGPDAFRLYLLNSPVVRAEPLRFKEKDVEQVLKDAIIPLQNVVNFFTTYAKVDTYKHPGTELYIMRHGAKATVSQDSDVVLSQVGIDQLNSQYLQDQVICISPDTILCSPADRCVQTAAIVQSHLAATGKHVEIISDARLALGQEDRDCIELYQEYIERGTSVLLITHGPVIETLSTSIVGQARSVDTAEIIKLPLTPLRNELDQWIYAELYAMIEQLDTALGAYRLDAATATVLTFIDKLTNRYLRRSRRRFWATGLDEDKMAAYTTLYDVITTYLKLLAPFAPFITEHLRKQMQDFSMIKNKDHSIHLEYRPLQSRSYINRQLMDEITTVRTIIRQALSIRAKAQIKVKIPLKSLSFTIS